MKLSFKLALLFFTTMTGPGAYAGGTDVFFGGDPIVESFQTYQREMVYTLELIPKELLPQPDFIKRYQEKIDNTAVGVSDERLYKNDMEFMILNFPTLEPQRIVISRSLWNSEKLMPSGYQKLALHETLHLMGYDDSRYAYSSRLMTLIDFFQGPPRPQSLIKILSMRTVPELHEAVIYSLKNIFDVLPLKAQFLTDQDMTALLAFAFRGFTILSEDDLLIVRTKILAYLEAYTRENMVNTELPHNKAYDCTFGELERYMKSEPKTKVIYSNIQRKGYVRPEFSTITKQCNTAF